MHKNVQPHKILAQYHDFKKCFKWLYLLNHLIHYLHNQLFSGVTQLLFESVVNLMLAIANASVIPINSLIEIGHFQVIHIRWIRRLTFSNGHLKTHYDFLHWTFLKSFCHSLVVVFILRLLLQILGSYFDYRQQVLAPIRLVGPSMPDRSLCSRYYCRLAFKSFLIFYL